MTMAFFTSCKSELCSNVPKFMIEAYCSLHFSAVFSVSLSLILVHSDAVSLLVNTRGLDDVSELQLYRSFLSS